MDTVLKNLTRAEYFVNSKEYGPIVEKAKKLYKQGKITESVLEMSYLPDEDVLFEQLYRKLQGKSVATGLKKVLEKKITNKYAAIKVYSSLLTHIMIEAEQGDESYLLLTEPLLEKITELL